MKKRGTRKIIPGINVQWPWSELIVNGRKTIETRSYDIPEKHRGVELAIIETPGPHGRKQAGIQRARIVGTVVFEKTYPYVSEAHWKKEEPLHRVPVDEPQFRYRKDSPKWAWVVKKVIRLNAPQPAPHRRGIVFANGCQITVR